jgi:hypothetical protein
LSMEENRLNNLVPKRKETLRTGFPNDAREV